MKRSPLSRRASLRRVRVIRRSRRAVGFDRQTKALVMDRDGHRCVCCSRTGADAPLTVHHRRNRGAGGSSDPLMNTAPNGLTVCWACNRDMESDPNFAEVARERGWKVSHYADPAEVPVLYPDGWWLLTATNRKPVAA